MLTLIDRDRRQAASSRKRFHVQIISRKGWNRGVEIQMWRWRLPVKRRRGSSHDARVYRLHAVHWSVHVGC
jgi:hypothetical protein